VNIQRGAIVERNTGRAFVTGFSILLKVFTIDGFCQDPGTCSLSHTPWSAKQEGVCQLIIFDCIPQCSSDMRLSYYGIEILRSVFSCRYDKLIHPLQVLFANVSDRQKRKSYFINYYFTMLF
jgi:hypothetical protein